MSKNQKSRLLFSLILSTLISFTPTLKINAATFEFPSTIHYLSGSGITPPVDPNLPDPNHPLKPKDPDGTKPQPGMRGPLSIDFISIFDFGNHDISNQDQTYFAKSQKYFETNYSSQNYIQVTDNRGTLAGWVLRLREEGQLKETKAGKYPELKGAFLSLLDPQAESNTDSSAPNVQALPELIPNSDQIIAQADKGSGAGTWVIRWGSQKDLVKKTSEELTSKVQLFVPGSTGKDASPYTTTLTWTLSSLPPN